MSPLQTIPGLPSSIKRKLGVIQIGDLASDSELKSSDGLGAIRRLDASFDGDSVLQFARNDAKTYRELVRLIWDLARTLPLDDQPQPSGWLQSVASYLPWNWGISYTPVELEWDPFPSTFERMCSLINKSKAFNPTNHQCKDIRSDPNFFAILENQHFKDWLEHPLPAMRIVGSCGWNLRALCSSLPSFRPDHHVLHLDCETLSRECGPMGGQWTGNSLIGPLILWMSQVAVSGVSSEADFVECLFNQLKAKGKLVQYSTIQAKPDAFAQLVLFIEQLGSTMVQVVDKALDDFLGSEGKARPLMLILSGLHVFRRSPELGRLTYCIRELHRCINKYRTCRLLVTHDQRQDLDGLLREFRCLGDDEHKGK